MIMLIFLFTFLELCAIAFRVFVSLYNPANYFYKMMSVPSTWLCVGIGAVLLILIGVEIFIRVRTKSSRGSDSVSSRVSPQKGKTVARLDLNKSNRKR